MAMKRESGGKKPMAKMANKAKTKPKTVAVDPSSAVSKITAAKKKIQADIGGDYASSRAMDGYAKELKKYGITINPAKDNPYYRPASGKSIRKAPKGR